MAPGDIVFDVGAHTGRFVRLAARRVGREGRVYGFEPVQRTYRVLERTVALRRLHQVHLVRGALSDRTGSAEITVPLRDGWKPMSPVAHLGAGDGAEGHKETVTLEPLDDFCAREGVSRVDFMKCDTEGHEAFVFRGGTKTLARSQPTIYVEIDEAWLERTNTEVRSSFDLLGSLGYRSFLPEGDGLRETEGFAGSADYFFVHPSRMNEQITQVLR